MKDCILNILWLVCHVICCQSNDTQKLCMNICDVFSFPQWRIIVGGTKCIPKSELPVEDDDPQSQPAAPPSSRLWLHPSDLSIALSASTPLYPPGRIIHVVHNHPPETWWENWFEECGHPTNSITPWPLQRIHDTLVLGGVRVEFFLCKDSSPQVFGDNNPKAAFKTFDVCKIWEEAARRTDEELSSWSIMCHTGCCAAGSSTVL